MCYPPCVTYRALDKNRMEQNKCTTNEAKNARWITYRAIVRLLVITWRAILQSRQGSAGILYKTDYQTTLTRWQNSNEGPVTPLLMFMHDVIIRTQNEAKGERPPSLAVAAPIASFWVSIVKRTHSIGWIAQCSIAHAFYSTNRERALQTFSFSFSFRSRFRSRFRGLCNRALKLFKSTNYYIVVLYNCI